RQPDPEVTVDEADEARAVEAAARTGAAPAVRDAEEVPCVRDDSVPQGTREVVVPARHQMAPWLELPNEQRGMHAVPFRRAGRASLQRAPERERQGERNGEQQYEEADRPHEAGRSRRWARPSEGVGRSLSAWGRTSAEARAARVPH